MTFKHPDGVPPALRVPKVRENELCADYTAYDPASDPDQSPVFCSLPLARFSPRYRCLPMTGKTFRDVLPRQ